jgi:hypothetical protein
VARQKQPTLSRGGGNFLVVLPASDLDTVAATVAYEPSCFDPYCDVPSYAQGCGLDRSTGEVYGSGYAECLAYRRQNLLRARTVAGPVTTRIKPASDDASLAGNSRDCFSHYDTDYDAIVYGAAIEASVSSQPDSALHSDPASGQFAVVRWSDLEWERSLLLFESLIDNSRGPINAQTLEPQLRNAQTIWLGARNAAERVLIRWGFPIEQPPARKALNWGEYAELIALTEPGQTFEAGAESLSSVQSGRWLLRFAASHMDSAGELLSAAAAELLRYAGEDRLANQPEPAQR